MVSTGFSRCSMVCQGGPAVVKRFKLALMVFDCGLQWFGQPTWHLLGEEKARCHLFSGCLKYSLKGPSIVGPKKIKQNNFQKKTELHKKKKTQNSSPFRF